MLLQIKIKNYQENTQNFGIKLKIKLKKVNDKTGEYEKGFMKIKLSADDNLSLSKMIK